MPLPVQNEGAGVPLTKVVIHLQVQLRGKDFLRLKWFFVLLGGSMGQFFFFW